MPLALAQLPHARGFASHARDRGLTADIRALTSLVSELTITLVVQGAWLSALRNGRSAPHGLDVDAAIATVATDVPESVADGLWESRDAIAARFRATDAAE